MRDDLLEVLSVRYALQVKYSEFYAIRQEKVQKPNILYIQKGEVSPSLQPPTAFSATPSSGQFN